MTDFGKILRYGPFVETDPIRNGLHYPAIMRLLGDLRKKILDVGCGDGRLLRLLAEQGNNVVGYDPAPEKIAEAKAIEAAHPLGIEYVVAASQAFSHEERFDDATSVLVLPYVSVEDLSACFRSTAAHLVQGGKFASVVFRPGFTEFGQIMGNRRFTKLNGKDVQVEFLDPATKETQFTSVLHQHTQKEYEEAIRKGGMNVEAWKPLYATRQSIEKMGEPFWEACHREQPYAMLIAREY